MSELERELLTCPPAYNINFPAPPQAVNGGRPRILSQK